MDGGLSDRNIDCGGARGPGSCALLFEEVGKWKFFMAYMHESVHICHVDLRFLLPLPFSVNYPVNFVYKVTAYVPMHGKWLNLTHENVPEEVKNGK